MIFRAFQVVIVGAIFWYVLAMIGAVDPPNLQAMGQRGRAVTNTIERSGQDFSRGFGEVR